VKRSSPWVRAVATLLTVSTALVLTAGPAAAGESPRPAATGVKLSLAAAAQARAAVVVPAASAYAQAAAAPATSSSRSFFRTPTGVAALVLMAVGGGYTLYSVSHDRKPVKSPIR
jgi:hypothetical protein